MALMEGVARKPARRLWWPVRVIRARPRLFASGLVGTLVVAVLPPTWRMATRLLVAWDVAVTLYLGLVYRLMARSRVGHIRLRARVEDEGRNTILALSAAAALASLGAIVVELGSSSVAGGGRPPGQLALAMLTIVLSWAFTHTIFALHYAHEYYDENDGKGGGMEFPDKECEPDYWDFMYFSFVIGMCAQVSDVTVSCRPIRRTVFGHSVVSFVFNAALLALTVNIAASAI
jgi:uncharacterized membrane protein